MEYTEADGDIHENVVVSASSRILLGSPHLDCKGVCGDLELESGTEMDEVKPVVVVVEVVVVSVAVVGFVVVVAGVDAANGMELVINNISCWLMGRPWDGAGAGCTSALMVVVVVVEVAAGGWLEAGGGHDGGGE